MTVPTTDLANLAQRQDRLEGTVKEIAEVQKSQGLALNQLISAVSENAANVKQVNANIQHMADVQDSQWKTLNSTVTNTQVLSANAGRFTAGQWIAIVGPLLAFLAAAGALFIAPLQLRQTISERDAQAMQRQIDDINNKGTVGMQTHMAADEIRWQATNHDVSELQRRERQRLEEEAALGRAVLHKAVPGAALPKP